MFVLEEIVIGLDSLIVNLLDSTILLLILAYCGICYTIYVKMKTILSDMQDYD